MIDEARIEGCNDEATIAERHALQVLTSFPARVITSSAGIVVLSIDGDKGCVALITAEAAEIRLPTTEWTCGAYGPRESTRFWKRVSLQGPRSSYKKLDEVIGAAIEARKAEFRPCCFCKGEFPPEHMADDACHGCASAERGIVF